MSKLSEKNHRKLRFATYTHTSSLFFITVRAVRAIIAHTVIVVNKIFGGRKPVIVSAIMANEPNLHDRSISHILSTVKFQFSHSNRTQTIFSEIRGIYE